MRSTLVSSIGSLFLMAPIACGGSNPSELFTGNGPVDSGGAGAQDSTSPPVDSGAPPEKDAASADTGVVEMDSSSVLPDVFTVPEASGVDSPSSTWGITCGMTTCSGPAQFCCVAGPTGAQTDTCVSGTNNCNAQADTPVSCTSSAQCQAGQLCCGRMSNGSYTDITCRMTCAGSNEYVFCDPNVPNDCAGATPNSTCTMSTILDGFFRCN